MTGGETRVTKVSLDREPAASDEFCLVVLYGPELGKKYVLDGEKSFSIGRDEKNFIVVDLDNVSRRHAEILLQDGTFSVVDLGSTNGTYVNNEEIEEARTLRSGDLVKIGGAIFKFLSGDNIEAMYHEEIYQLAICDGLTQVSNKRYFLEYLEREMGRCHRYGRALSLIMFDIDHFKELNDRYGHLAGDSVLREFADVVRTRVRKEECFARYGGEEFAYVVPESGPENTRTLAEKVRKLVEGFPFSFEGKTMRVTVSVGVADLTADMLDPWQFIKVADQNLYKAKRAGRNRVVG
jgi:two-component system, cell cycle response regulator